MVSCLWAGRSSTKLSRWQRSISSAFTRSCGPNGWPQYSSRRVGSRVQGLGFKGSSFLLTKEGVQADLSVFVGLRCRG